MGTVATVVEFSSSVIKAEVHNSIKASISGSTTGIYIPCMYVTDPGKSLIGDGPDNVN
jgi:hypothetical protein